MRLSKLVAISRLIFDSKHTLQDRVFSRHPDITHHLGMYLFFFFTKHDLPHARRAYFLAKCNKVQSQTTPVKRGGCAPHFDPVNFRSGPFRVLIFLLIHSQRYLHHTVLSRVTPKYVGVSVADLIVLQKGGRF